MKTQAYSLEFYCIDPRDVIWNDKILLNWYKHKVKYPEPLNESDFFNPDHYILYNEQYGLFRAPVHDLYRQSGKITGLELIPISGDDEDAITFNNIKIMRCVRRLDSLPKAKELLFFSLLENNE